MQFEEEPIPYFELAPGECSSPQHLDEVSNDSSYVFSDNSHDVMDVDDISLDDSPLRPKWAEKIIQAARELAGNSLEPRKTRSQIHNASYASESALTDHCYMIIGYDPQSYLKACHDPRWKTTMEEEFHSLQENETWELVPLPPKRKLVQCKWVFQKKIAAYGSYVKYNSILVAM